MRLHATLTERPKTPRLLAKHVNLPSTKPHIANGSEFQSQTIHVYGTVPYLYSNYDNKLVSNYCNYGCCSMGLFGRCSSAHLCAFHPAGGPVQLPNPVPADPVSQRRRDSDSGCVTRNGLGLLDSA